MLGYLRSQPVLSYFLRAQWGAEAARAFTALYREIGEALGGLMIVREPQERQVSSSWRS